MDRPTSRAARQESLREHNLALVAREVLSAESPLSRADVAARTGLNRATVSRLVAELVAGQLIAEDAPVVAGAGRPATPLRPAAGTVGGLGLEVSVDFVGARVVDLAGQTIAEEIVAGEHTGSAATVLGQLGDLGREVAERAHLTGTQVAGTTLALPGLVAQSRLLVAPNLGWQEVDPSQHLGALPGDRPRLDNEARLAALAELARGPMQSFLYVSGGVGIGAAIVHDGVLSTGVHGFAGELGHVCVDPAGRRCRCGATGCLETFAGTAAILHEAALPEASDLRQVSSAVEQGENRARQAVLRAGHALGTALAALVNLVDVSEIVLGNTLAELTEPMRPAIEAELGARVLATRWAPTNLRAATTAAHPALTGAARAALAPVVDNPSGWLSQAGRDPAGQVAGGSGSGSGNES